MKHPYAKMAGSIYLNYLLLGMINIMLASNMSYLAEQLNVERTEISLLISALGIGHLLTINISGKLSDRFGRKPLNIAAALFYSIFLIGMPLTSSFYVAIGLALIAGMSNSLLDSGSYPAINEAFPEKAGTATVLLKAFVSSGAAMLPVLMAFLIGNDYFYGYAFFVPAILFLLGLIFTVSSKFPSHKMGAYDHYLVDYSEVRYPFSVKPKFWREGVVLIFIGFTSVSISTIVQTWLPTYAEQELGLPKLEAVGLLSFYSIGGLISVIVLATFLNRLFKPVTAMVVYPMMASIMLILFILNPFIGLTTFLAFLLGLFMSGIFQLTVAVMVELFHENKGTSVAYISASSSVAFIVIPYGTGLLAKYVSISSVFILDIGIAAVSTIAALYVLKRYKKIYGER